jgi:urea carboxylase
MFDKILIANRGAIACRILRTLRRLKLASVAVYSEADRFARHVRMADEAICIGAAPARDSYLRQDRVIQAARDSGATAIHPGYGFLSENAEFATACEAAGIAFIGPSPAQLRDFGLKHTARELAAASGLPLLPGSGLLADLDAALSEANRIGYPVMLKSTAGGGGIGMQQCADAAELTQAFETVRRLASNNFSQSGVFLEKFLPRARHIEVQIFGDGHGTVIDLGERDCSVQRRNQKVLEETPAPNLTEATRNELRASAVRLGRAVNYRSAGTVEFVYDADSGCHYFLEVNTRLQVEHGVTEAVTGVDLVEWMIRVAANEPPDLAGYQHAPQGHAIQARVYAEDPARNFRPSSGLLSMVQLPDDVRVDSWIETGLEVPAFYDPLLAKIIAHATTREQAIAGLDAALARSAVHGIETNLPYLRTILANDTFKAGEQTTRLLNAMPFAASTIEVLQPGTHTLVQDWPGRLGLWNVGVPPSGPMDALAFRLANRLLGNDEGLPALELTVSGPTLRFACDTSIALTGALMSATLNDTPVPWWQSIKVAAGGVLRIGSIDGAGQRSYLAFHGGLDVPDYMGSSATFTLGQFGGHAGRALRTGDVLRLHATGHAGTGAADRAAAGATDATAGAAPEPLALRSDLIPVYSHQWEIGVLAGPHAAPDFFTAEDIETFYATVWKVHYNSSRTGVRLIGPKPQWARRDGGEAGLHPSNIHDNAYAVGTIDFTGDMPVILGPDGPSLGGFVCPATIALAEMWKVGQLRPGDGVHFQRMDIESARVLLATQDQLIAMLAPAPAPASAPAPALVPATTATRRSRSATAATAVLHTAPSTESHASIAVRQAGDDNLLIEFGPAELDLSLRFQVQALYESLQQQSLPGIIDLTPGIRSLQLHFDSRRLSQTRALEVLLRAVERLPPVGKMELPSRIVHLPLSWDDPATRLAIERYTKSVRADAPWCPSNIEFIRRINGLASIDDVQRIVFDASYLVLGLGDVYLGAPVATPLDPRHRLVTTKYNPARTWTPENAVGIGGAYMCIYGMEGPGGYQFVGRTLQMWNRFNQTAEFHDGKPWLLRFFDQIRFYPVGADELLQMRASFPYGGCGIRIEPATLSLATYNRFLTDNATSIESFRVQQRAAFAAERERWNTLDQSPASQPEAAPPLAVSALPAGCVAISAPLSGSVWQLRVAPGQRVESGTELLVLESMKMEISVRAEQAGTIAAIHCAPGMAVDAGALLLTLKA